MAKPDLSKLSAADRLALAKELAAFEQRDALLTKLVEAFKADLDEAGATVVDAVKLLAPRKPRGPNKTMPAGKKAAAKKTRGVAAKTTSPSVDKDGGKPIPGKTYLNPDTGTSWTKDASGKGAPKKEFLPLIAAGATWAELAKGRKK